MPVSSTPSLSPSADFPALPASPRAWLTSRTTRAQLAQLAWLHLTYQLAAHPGVVPPRFRGDAIKPAPRWRVPPALRPLDAALYAWARGCARYAEQHRRTPQEVAEDNWHWGAQFTVWPERPPTGRMARQLPYRVIPTQPGVVRVTWYSELSEMVDRDARRTPEMYAHLRLEPDGSLKIGDIRRQWNMENMYFVEWNAHRFCLWPSADGETLSAVALRHLISTGEQWPFLRVIERPCQERRALRLERQRLLDPVTAPAHMRAYLRARRMLFRTLKTWYAFRRPFLHSHVLPPSETTRKRTAVACALLLGLAAVALAVSAVLGASWAVRTYVVPEAIRVYEHSGAVHVVYAVTVWAKSEPEVMWAIDGALWAMEQGWVALCTLPMFAFWALTLPVWGPFWLTKVILLGVWWVVMTLLWAALASLRRGALGVKAAVW